MKRLFVFSYPKLTIYILAIAVSYFIFQIPSVLQFVSSFDNLLYIPVFIGGLLYTVGFTAPISTGFFLALHPSNILIASLIGAAGALITDIALFSFIRLSFMDEFRLLERSSLIKHIMSGVRMIFPKKLRSFLVYIFVAIIIASPLPDELGVALLAGFTKFHPYSFMTMSYIGNTLGIFILLWI